MLKHLTNLILTVALGLLLAPASNAQCVRIADEKRDYTDEAQRLGKVHSAIGIISNDENLATDEVCAVAAMRYLGLHRVETAIPRLIQLLSYRIKPVTPPQRKLSVGDMYPATDALFQIGVPAVPALLEVISNHEKTDIESKNALYTLMQIYRTEPAKGIALLTAARDRETDNLVAARLTKAIVDAEIWCKPEGCNRN